MPMNWTALNSNSMLTAERPIINWMAIVPVSHAFVVLCTCTRTRTNIDAQKFYDGQGSYILNDLPHIKHDQKLTIENTEHWIITMIYISDFCWYKWSFTIHFFFCICWMLIWHSIELIALFTLLCLIIFEFSCCYWPSIVWFIRFRSWTRQWI